MASSPAEIASAFRITFQNAHAPSHAALSKVFILDDRYVLRGRPHEEQTLTDFEKEMAMIDLVRPLVPFRFPEPLATPTGERAIAADGWLWTIYPVLQGKILGTWQQGASAMARTDMKKILAAMHLLHDRTKGLFPAPQELWLVQSVRAEMQKNPSVLAAEEKKLIDQSMQRITRRTASLKKEDFCFVHGDFHHANVLTDDRGEIYALLDLNWCRIGHPLEDLAYTFTMFLSDYRDPFVLDDQRMRMLVRDYDPAYEADLFFLDLFAVATLYDVFLFTAQRSEHGDFYARYRRALLSEIQKRIGATVP